MEAPPCEDKNKLLPAEQENMERSNRLAPISDRLSYKNSVDQTIFVYCCEERKAGHNVCLGIMNFFLRKPLKMKKQKGVYQFLDVDETNIKTIKVKLSESDEVELYYVDLPNRRRIVCFPNENYKNTIKGSEEVTLSEIELGYLRDFTICCLKKSTKTINVYQATKLSTIFDIEEFKNKDCSTLSFSGKINFLALFCEEFTEKEIAEVRGKNPEIQILAINDEKETNLCDKSIDDLFGDSNFYDVSDLKGKHVESLRPVSKEGEGIKKDKGSEVLLKAFQNEETLIMSSFKPFENTFLACYKETEPQSTDEVEETMKKTFPAKPSDKIKNAVSRTFPQQETAFELAAEKEESQSEFSNYLSYREQRQAEMHSAMPENGEATANQSEYDWKKRWVQPEKIGKVPKAMKKLLFLSDFLKVIENYTSLRFNNPEEIEAAPQQIEKTFKDFCALIELVSPLLSQEHQCRNVQSYFDFIVRIITELQTYKETLQISIAIPFNFAALLRRIQITPKDILRRMVSFPLERGQTPEYYEVFMLIIDDNLLKMNTSNETGEEAFKKKCLCQKMKAMLYKSEYLIEKRGYDEEQMIAAVKNLFFRVYQNRNTINPEVRAQFQFEKILQTIARHLRKIQYPDLSVAIYKKLKKPFRYETCMKECCLSLSEEEECKAYLQMADFFNTMGFKNQANKYYQLVYEEAEDNEDLRIEAAEKRLEMLKEKAPLREEEFQKLENLIKDRDIAEYTEEELPSEFVEKMKELKAKSQFVSKEFRYRMEGGKVAEVVSAVNPQEC